MDFKKKWIMQAVAPWVEEHGQGVFRDRGFLAT